MNQWKQHAHALSTGLEANLTIVIVSELLHTNWTDYICLLESRFPDLQINIVSAPQEDALQMLLDGSAQLALMFEREHLDNREQFVELKREALIPVISNNHPLAGQNQVTYEQILTTRQIVVASRDETLKPELLFSKHYWRTDNHHSACLMILRNLGWGVLPQEMFKNPELKINLKYWIY